MTSDELRALLPTEGEPGKGIRVRNNQDRRGTLFLLPALKYRPGPRRAFDPTDPEEPPAPEEWDEFPVPTGVVDLLWLDTGENETLYFYWPRGKGEGRLLLEQQQLSTLSTLRTLVPISTPFILDNTGWDDDPLDLETNERT